MDCDLSDMQAQGNDKGAHCLTLAASGLDAEWRTGAPRMKTTIKTGDGEALTVQPFKIAKAISIAVSDKFGNVNTVLLEPDQVGVLLFSIEQACEQMGVEL